MNQQPPLTNHQPASEQSAAQHTPFMAMWYQTREALADFLIPILAGLKAVWLIALSPTKFFKTDLQEPNNLPRLRTPFDVAWRALEPGERPPLDAAKFLFFGILTAALAGFGFDNSNRLSGLLAQTGVSDNVQNGLAGRVPALAVATERLAAIAENETLIAIQAFFDQDLIAAIIEFIVTLFIIMIFAYLFRLAAGRQISSTDSYSFWLYLTGMNYFTTAITFVFFKIFSLPVIDLPQFTPELFFLLIEYAWLILWLWLLPLIILPRLFPALTVRRTLAALLLTHGIFLITGWLFRAGFTTILLAWSSLAERL